VGLFASNRWVTGEAWYPVDTDFVSAWEELLIRVPPIHGGYRNRVAQYPF
jgi:hypothetical protein